MKTLFVARRYFFSRKQKTVINIISWISLVGIAVGTAALIVVLSVYNGIGLLTQSLFNSFDPPLLVQPAKGKTFHTADIDMAAISRIPGVTAVAQIVEENAWLTYRQNEAIVTLRGVDAHYTAVTGLDTLLYEGEYQLKNDSLFSILLGAELYYGLGIRESSNHMVAVHIPKRGLALGNTMDEAFNTAYAYPAGNFYIQQEIDSRYVVADIDFVRDLLDYAPDECSALALALAPSAKIDKVNSAVANLLGGRFTVKDRFQQQPVYYKVFRSERLGIYLILALIVLIATLNLMASISLLVLDKKKDIFILRSMGMQPKEVRYIFRVEGVLISLVGIISGMAIGFLVCFVQQQFGIIKMGENFVVSAFPVTMRAVDFLFTFLLVAVLSTVAILLAVRKNAS